MSDTWWWISDTPMKKAHNMIMIRCLTPVDFFNLFFLPQQQWGDPTSHKNIIFRQIIYDESINNWWITSVFHDTLVILKERRSVFWSNWCQKWRLKTEKLSDQMVKAFHVFTVVCILHFFKDAKLPLVLYCSYL